jgi:Helix-turn-helix domain
MKNEPSQVEMIFDHLMTGSKLTGLDALKMFGTIKTPNRIGDIEKRYGVTVQREWTKVKTRFGEKRIMEYFLKPIPKM